jgi:hypothetical protein
MFRLLSVVSLVLALSGCAVVSPNTPIEALARQDVANGKNIGALVGAGIGGIIGNNTQLGVEHGVQLGAIAGSLSGEIVGKVVAKRRLQYASEKQYLESEIGSAGRAISKKQAQLGSLKNRVAETRQEISNMERRDRQNQDVTAEAQGKVRELDTIIANNEVSLAKYKDTINYLDETLATSRKQPDTKGLETQRNQLIAQRSQVQSQFRSLQGINDNAKTARARARVLAKTPSSSSHKSGSGDHNPLSKFIPNGVSKFIPNF